jgi:hypothetical protein
MTATAQNTIVFQSVENDPSFRTTSMAWLAMNLPSFTERIAVYTGSRFEAIVLKLRDGAYYIQMRDGQHFVFPLREDARAFLADEFGLCHD